MFVHLAIDGKVHPTLGITFCWPTMPAAGESLTLKGSPMSVEDVRQEPDGRWVMYLRNLDA